MKICIVHTHRPTRQVLARALARRLNAEVVDFSCIEDVLYSSMEYDVFVVYSSMYPDRIDRVEGAKILKQLKPDALVVSMIHKRFFDRKYGPPGADLLVFCAGNDIDSLVKFIEQHLQNKIRQK